MMILAGFLYLTICTYIATNLLRRIVSVRPNVELVARVQIFTAIFFSVFYSGFYFLGYVTLLTGQGVVNVPYALAILTLVAVALALRPTPAGSSGQLRTLIACARSMLATKIVAGTTITFALVGIMLMFGFPQGFEVLAYHLPGAVEILQMQSLKAWDGNFPHTFPANASIFAAFFLSFVPEKLVSAINLIFLLPLVTGTFALSLRAGADRNASLLAACGVLSVPMIAFSSVELSADVGGLAFIVLAMYFALEQSTSRNAALGLAGVCAGLALGFKSVHLISIGVIGLLILVRDFSGKDARVPKLWPGIQGLSIFIAAAAVTGSFWLTRNYVSFGNPFYPVNLPVIGDLLGWAKAADVDFSQRHATQFEWVRRPVDWLSYPWVEWHVLGQNFKHSSGLGAFFAASVPVSLCVVGAAVIRNGVHRHQVRFILFLTIAFVMGTWWGLDDHQPRYAFAALAYCMPLVAWVVTQADMRWRPRFDRLLGLCIALMLLIFLSKQAILFADRILLSGYTTRSLYYEYPHAIDNLPRGATILNLAERPWHYPLAGARLSNRVISMPEGRRMLGLAPNLGAPRTVALQSARLQASGVSHIFVAGAAVTADGCMHLEEIGRTDRNSYNGAMLGSPRVLFSVTYAATADSANCSAVKSTAE